MSFYNDVDMDGASACQAIDEVNGYNAALPRSQEQPAAVWPYSSAPTIVYPAHDSTLSLTMTSPTSAGARRAESHKHREDRARKARALALLKEQYGTEATKEARRLRRREVFKIYKSKRKAAAYDYMAVDSASGYARRATGGTRADKARGRGWYMRDKQVDELALLLASLSW
ncbi:hypothetical protein AURDEDRAFT_112282 [Auricularia subglabra TFB-10046 SS5]|nr:hypothetical protein AURDEDRAFT_112282 [Auricularia subglabra TFB-10046 SS5]